MSVRFVIAVAEAALVEGVELAARPDPAGAYTLTAGRFWSLVAALLGLAGVVIGGLALARSRRTG